MFSRLKSYLPETGNGADEPEPSLIAVDEQQATNPEWLVTDLVEYSIAMGASDIFFATNENDIEVSVRHLGIIRQVARLAPETGIRCMAYIHGAANLKYAERRHPQDGRWIFTRADGLSLVDLRISTVPTLYGESLAMRILRRDSQLTRLQRLGFIESQLASLQSLLQSPGGLILVTGPTGSGKTTTLYACLHQLNDGRKKIHTIEDPVEYAVPGLRQTQTDDANGAGFAEMLRAILRQGPDVIMIGEVRDRATAETAVRAANSGQLVLATMHAPVAATAIQALLGLGIAPTQLCSSLLGVVGQRLIRVLNAKTRIPIDLTEAPHTFDEVRAWLLPEEGKIVYGAAGPSESREAFWYEGRSGVFEVLVSSPEIRRLINDGHPASALAQKAVEEGMIDFRRAALLKVAYGLTSFDEMQRCVPTGNMWVDE